MDFDLTEALVEREPVTIVVSEKGWIRALKGHVEDVSGLQFKGDDALLASLLRRDHVENSGACDQDGKIYTLEAAKLPGGRGHGEPIKLMVDIDKTRRSPPPSLRAGAKMLVASSDGRGFVAAQDEMIGGTRKGKALINVDAPAKASVIVPVEGDHVATIGENRKMLVFPLDASAGNAAGGKACGCSATRMAVCRTRASSNCAKD